MRRISSINRGNLKRSFFYGEFESLEKFTKEWTISLRGGSACVGEGEVGYFSAPNFLDHY